jgi:hypothetical protein
MLSIWALTNTTEVGVRAALGIATVTGLIVTAIVGFSIPGSRRAYADEVAAWESDMREWKSQYYCFRCDRTFWPE